MRAGLVGVVVVVLVAAAVAVYRLDGAASAPATAKAPAMLMTRTAASGLVTLQLEVKVHPKSTPQLTQDQAELIASQGSDLLQKADSNTDVECAVKLVIQNLTKFRVAISSSGIVNSPVAFDALFNDVTTQADELWHVRVVKEITWCNTFVPAGGCADINSRRIAVARRMPAVEGILWAHEVGHTQGLLHREDSTVALMWPSILPDHSELTNAECTAFKR